jgi:hypothetical protein
MSDSTSSTVGNINKAGSPFIHNFGTSNTFIGKNAGNFTTSGAGLNTGIGVNALTTNGIGINNTAVGANALAANTAGTKNIAVGSSALAANTTGTNNIAIGEQALLTNMSGIENVAVGQSALSVSTVSGNTAIGAYALLANTTGISNVAVGFRALAANTTGTHNTAIGQNASQTNTTGGNNTAVGYFALNLNVSGINNTAFGSQALISATSTANTAIGAFAGSSLTTGANNVIIGASVGGSTTTGSNNIYIDGSSLSPANESNVIRIGNNGHTAAFMKGIFNVSLTTPQLVTIVSGGQLGSMSTAGLGTSSNTPSTLVARDASGNFAAQDVSMVDAIVSGFINIPTTSSLSVGTIQQNGSRFIHSFGTNNTFVGTSSGNFTMIGTGNNTAIGTNSLLANTTGSDNTALGRNALTANTTGQQNTIIGSSAGAAITTGTNNVMVGFGAGSSTTTGINNIYIDGTNLPPANESNVIRIGNASQTAAFIRGIFGVSISSPQAVTIGAAGQLGSSTIAGLGTSSNTASTLVARDASGNFSAGTITASLTGSASNNVLKAGDTMTGALQLPAGTTAAPSLVFTGSTTTGLSAATANTLSFSTAATERMKISATGIVSINGLNSAGVIHTDASGNLSTSLIVNADVSASAAIVDTKLATISTAGKVSNSATTATSANTASAIVARDASGNFAAQDVSMVDAVVSGFINIPTTSSLSVGTIQQNGSRFIHSLGTNNTYVGTNSGSFTVGSASNTAIGASSMSVNTTGSNNTAVGRNTLTVNTTGAQNTAIGMSALAANTVGIQNTAIGASVGAAINTGTNNVMVGFGIGSSTTTGSNNIYIDGNSLSPANESNVIRIGNVQTKCFVKGIRGITTGVADAIAVLVDSQGQLGTVSSSIRFKTNINPMRDVSEHIYDLQPVSFVYKSDETATTQFGLIAEEVDAVFPELVIYEEDGTPYTVRYEVLPVLLLNEMKKQKAVNEQHNIIINNLLERVAALEARG